MDFYHINQRRGKNGVIEVFPDFRVCRSKDLMVRAKSFYAIWDEQKGLWSTDEYDVQRLVDADLDGYERWLKQKSDDPVQVMSLGSFGSGSWMTFQSYLRNMSDNAHDLDRTVTFANTEVKKEDYVSRRLPYSLPDGPGSCPAYDELIGTLYEPQEREKLEWAVGAIVSGDSTWIQKFVVLYGAAGAGKSTFLNIVQKLFEGYYTTFEAKALVGNSNQFATEAFGGNPLVAIQHDGDLSRIEDNTKLNSLISHEMMRVNEKNKPTYDMVSRAFMFMGTNKPVKITDAKSGIIRRLIDVRPSGERVSPVRYQTLMTQIRFELGDIAKHCLQVYSERGPDYYSGYVPVEMMLQTDVFYNFIETNVLLFTKQDGTSLTQAYELYKQYCEEALIDYKLPRHKFREELKNYFREWHDRWQTPSGPVRSWYSGFKTESFASVIEKPSDDPVSLVFSPADVVSNVFNRMAADCPAQLAVAGDKPGYKWDNVRTSLRDIDTTQVHFVRGFAENHIVIDFDLKDENGEKSLELNLKEASKWPPTYAELSKGGNGIHLHYLYDGDVDMLAPLYSEGIEIKVFRGLSSLRRRLSQCNHLEIAHLSGGLPQREKRMIDQEAVKDEKHLRALVDKALRKEIQPNTKPAIDFIAHILLQAYESGMEYDLTDVRTAVLGFATGSSNNGLYCIKVVNGMKFKSKAAEEAELNEKAKIEENDGKIVIYDVEVYPNLFIVSWKYFREEGTYSMVNPSVADISWLMTQKLVGFYNRDYDNHIVYAAHLGYNNAQLFDLSQRLVNGDRGAKFGAAFNLSYLDIYEMASEKNSLKKWEILLGLPHVEMDIPWDAPVPDDMVDKVVKYCENDVEATEKVLEERWQDYVAREILASISGLRMNAKTQEHTARIIFGTNRRPQNEFVYTDLATEFEGYSWQIKSTGIESTYRGEVVGEGGYVYAEPGMYNNVALLDIASMHPTSLVNLNYFGSYTKNFDAIKQARIAIKHEEYEAAGKMFDGKLKPYLGSKEDASKLAYALKIAINIVYGMTSAKYENIFRHPLNKDNIVAKRGALFMIDLKHYVQEMGFTVVHIKTDSIKIADATHEVIDAVMEFGQSYGYDFEHEATYEKLCLVNDAVYVAKTLPGRKPAHWTATGAQFIEPYTFKTLFTREKVEFKDLVLIKSVQTALYLDYSIEEPLFAMDPDYVPSFIGKVGGFVPVQPGTRGGVLLRVDKNDPTKFHAATGTKGYLWKEAQVVEATGNTDDVDMRYYENLASKAVENMATFGDVEMFLDPK